MKVRIKSLEDMPASSKCCLITIQAMKEFNGKEVHVIPVPVKNTDTCPWCGATRTDNTFEYSDGSPFMLFLDQFDIDEGQVN